MLDLGGAVRRHRIAVASYLALVLAVSTVVVYAVAAQGYKTHQTRLNDGGIWVTDNRDSVYGRMNKPIGQLDGRDGGRGRARRWSRSSPYGTWRTLPTSAFMDRDKPAALPPQSRQQLTGNVVPPPQPIPPPSSVGDQSDSDLRTQHSHRTTPVTALAHAADRHVFGPHPPAADAAAAYWRDIDTERRAMSRAAGRPRRLLAALSLASFRRW